MIGGGSGTGPSTTTTGTGVVTAIGNNTNVAGGLVVPAAALTANALVIGGGSGTGPSTTTTGTGVLTALGINVGSAGAVLTTNTSNTITIGYAVTPYSIGTVSSGTTTPAPANGNYQYLTNNGAFTLAAPATDCAIDILVTNGASAGAITFSGYTVGSATGSTYGTTNTNKFLLSIRRINSVSTYSWYALQ